LPDESVLYVHRVAMLLLKTQCFDSVLCIISYIAFAPHFFNDILVIGDFVTNK
jgi:hypothetical protein